MHINKITSGGGRYTKHLLRVSYRSGGKVKKKTLLNLSRWQPAHLIELREALRYRRQTGDIAVAHQRILSVFAKAGLARQSLLFELSSWLNGSI